MYFWASFFSRDIIWNCYLCYYIEESLDRDGCCSRNWSDCPVPSMNTWLENREPFERDVREKWLKMYWQSSYHPCPIKVPFLFRPRPVFLVPWFGPIWSEQSIWFEHSGNANTIFQSWWRIDLSGTRESKCSTFATRNEYCWAHYHRDLQNDRFTCWHDMECSIFGR